MNEKLAEDLVVSTEIMSLDAARKAGAIALFGEKYGSEVRVVTIGDGFDKELCGGTHVPTTGRIGRIALLGEGSIGSGVRRIDALVGDGAYDFHAKEHALVSQITTLLGGRPEDAPSRIEQVLAKLKEVEKELDRLRLEQTLAGAASLAEAAEDHPRARLVAKDAGELPSTDALRTLALDVRDRLGDRPGVVALVARVKDKPAIVVAVTPKAREAGFKAGAFVRSVGEYLGGGGGGRDDIAQGGGSRTDRIHEAIAAIRAEVAAS